MDVKIYRNRRKKNGYVGGFILEVKKHILIKLNTIQPSTGKNVQDVEV